MVAEVLVKARGDVEGGMVEARLKFQWLGMTGMQATVRLKQHLGPVIFEAWTRQVNVNNYSFAAQEIEVLLSVRSGIRDKIKFCERTLWFY